MIYAFSFCAVCLAFVTILILWNRTYSRRWHQSRGENWPVVAGMFDEGQIVPMRKGRSDDIVGYEVWLGYDYEADGKHCGVYRTREFAAKEEAEARLKQLANHNIIVHFDPKKMTRSEVLDEDLSGLIEPSTSVLTKS